MKLYYAPGTCAVACWIALEWAGADYEVEKVQLGTDEYRKINPLGAVPALDRRRHCEKRIGCNSSLHFEQIP